MLKFGSKGARQRALVSLLRHQQEATFEELATRFGVSEMTVRRDVTRLAADGIVARTLGGCMLRTPLVPEAPAAEKRRRQQAEKVGIGRAVVAMLCPGMRIYLDTGTTVEQVARQVPDDLEVQILTGNLPAAMALFGRFRGEVMLHGGRLGQHSPELTGDLAISQLRAFRLDAAIIGADGIDPASGEIYAADLASALVSRTAQERADSLILVADSSKFHRRGAAVVGELHPGMTVVTDTGLADDIADTLREHGCEVVLAAPDAAAETGGPCALSPSS